jgi:threonine dehydratase
MPGSAACEPPNLAAIEAAADRLAGIAVRTPLLESELLNDQLGGRLLIKAEVLQRTGSFKFRGAYNCLAGLAASERARGVVAYSSGNHGQGVAAAARRLGIAACIVMPSDAPASKIEATRAWGAEVVLYDRERENRETIAAAIAEARGAPLIRPYDDAGVIAGQGTVGLELAEQAEALAARLDAVLVPCSGGGLTAGIALALADRSPATGVYTVEPEGFDDTRRSLAVGHRVANRPGASSLCDALLVDRPGVVTFPVCARLVAGGLAVTDDETRAAMAASFRTYKLVVEPSGAVALAAALAGRFDARGRTVAAICSGGNVDPGAYVQALSDYRSEPANSG